MTQNTQPTRPLMDRLIDKVKQYHHLPQAWHYHAFVLWVVATYLHETFTTFPPLLPLGRAPVNGRYQLLRLAELLCFSFEKVTNPPLITDKELVQWCSNQPMTLQLETDKVVQSHGTTSGFLHEFIQCRANSTANFTMPMRTAGRMQATNLNIYGPLIIGSHLEPITTAVIEKVLGLKLKKLPQASRHLLQKDPTVDPEFPQLADEIAQWCLVNQALVASAYGALPTSLGRHEVWNPLLAVAQVLSPSSAATLLAVAKAGNVPSDDKVSVGASIVFESWDSGFSRTGKDFANLNTFVRFLGGRLPAGLQTPGALAKEMRKYRIHGDYFIYQNQAGEWVADSR